MDKAAIERRLQLIRDLRAGAQVYMQCAVQETGLVGLGQAPLFQAAVLIDLAADKLEQTIRMEALHG